MMYIHHTSCISPQQTFANDDLNHLQLHTAKWMQAIEPAYPGIPTGVLRRMGKSVRMGVGTAMQLLQKGTAVNGIIIGTANGGKEDCVKFLNQIVEYEEGLLTPINFVQSTPNAVAAQIGLLTANHGYNITHVHAGLAFENAVTDAEMMVGENPGCSFLLGAVDDISTYNYNFEEKQGWYKKDWLQASSLYDTNTAGSIPGEAAAMFLVNDKPNGAVAKLTAAATLHHKNVGVVGATLSEFLATHLPKGETIDLLLSGDNGDNRLLPFYTICEIAMTNNTTIARFKHICGEYPTATAMGLWLSCHILQQQAIPKHMIKKQGITESYKHILIYNNYKQTQHSFMLVSVPC